MAVQQYVARMMEGVSGMKALLLDKEVCNVCPWHSMWNFGILSGICSALFLS